MTHPKPRLLKLKRARVPGRCSLCNKNYRAGTILAPDGQGRWVHKTCAADGVTHSVGPLRVTEPYGKCACGGWLYVGRDHTCKGGV
jgi:hypothetical protein